MEQPVHNDVRGRPVPPDGSAQLGLHRHPVLNQRGSDLLVPFELAVRVEGLAVGPHLERLVDVAVRRRARLALVDFVPRVREQLVVVERGLL